MVPTHFRNTAMTSLRATPAENGVPFSGTPFGTDGRRIDAPAKVNLFLEVLRKRPDGFHDLETLIVLLELADTLELEPRTDGELRLECDEPGIPTGPTNLVWKAAEALRTRFGVTAGATIRLTKRIPHEAGLGGGSSDAAATLAALNVVWGLNRSAAELAPVAAQVGSDVAAFLYPPACWCTGRGEVVTPVPVGDSLHLVVVKPPLGLSTPAVYKACVVPETPVDGTPTRVALAAGAVGAVAAGLHNRLQPAAFALQPAVKAIYDALAATEPAGVLVSGSGSCVFAVARDAADAARIARAFAAPDCRLFVTRTRSPARAPTRP